MATAGIDLNLSDQIQTPCVVDEFHLYMVLLLRVEPSTLISHLGPW